tara:strand:+ start:35 stop:502 length:468 start_codon:yes stop_codon:yes gene_type:complete
VGFYSGRDGELYIAGSSTKAAKVQSWSFSSSMAVLETTSLGDTDRTLKAGVRSYSGSCRLFYYVESPSSGANSNLNAIIRNAIKAGSEASDGANGETPSIVLKLRLTTGSTDVRDIQFSVFITGVSMSTAVGEVASADISWEADGAPYGATSLVD